MEEAKSPVEKPDVVEVTLLGDAKPTAIKLRRYSARERNEAFRKSRIKSSPGAAADYDPTLFCENRVCASVESPVELRNKEVLLDKLSPGDFDKLLEAADALNELSPLWTGRLEKASVESE